MVLNVSVSDFSGFDALVHRRNISRMSDLGIRTLRGDTRSLNEPQFTGSFKDEKVQFVLHGHLLCFNSLCSTS